jgi:hypothetical protein
MDSELIESVRDALHADWRPLSSAAAAGWLSFYGLFLIYAATHRSGFLFIDNANLIVHESGHLFFGWFGRTIGLWGGTLMELLVPLALACYFMIYRQTAGAAFASFFFFENFLYISVYMADARAQALPLVTVGDPEQGGHDWFRIFSSLGLLRHDMEIAGAVNAVGWLGMLATVGWLFLRWRGSRHE